MQITAYSPKILASLADLAHLRGAALAMTSPNKKVRNQQSGIKPTTFRGRGMDYAESRAYAHGDDVRHVDWRVTARTGTLHTKLFEAERDGISAVLVQCDANMKFGTKGCLKSVTAAHLAALFAWLAERNGERVAGGCMGIPHDWVRPTGGRKGVMRLLAALVRWQTVMLSNETSANTPSQTMLTDALQALGHTLPSGSRTLLLADAYAFQSDATQALLRFRKNHDLAVMMIHDPAEIAINHRGVIPVHVTEKTSHLAVDFRQKNLRKQWTTAQQAQRTAAESLLTRYGIPCTTVSTMDDPATALSYFLQQTGRKR